MKPILIGAAVLVVVIAIYYIYSNRSPKFMPIRPNMKPINTNDFVGPIDPNANRT